MRPASIRSCHQSVACTSSRQAREVFQSSRTSWSSNTIADGTVDSSQRTGSGDHECR